MLFRFRFQTNVAMTLEFRQISSEMKTRSEKALELAGEAYTRLGIEGVAGVPAIAVYRLPRPRKRHPEVDDNGKDYAFMKLQSIVQKTSIWYTSRKIMSKGCLPNRHRNALVMPVELR